MKRPDSRGEYEKAVEMFYDVMEEYPSRKADAAKGAVKTLETWLTQCYDEKDYETPLVQIQKAEQMGVRSDTLTELNDTVEKKIAPYRPANGKKIRNNISWGYGKMAVTAGDRDVLLKVENRENPDKYLTVYIRKNETVNLNLEDGRYRMKYMTGIAWIGSNQMFGKAAEYYEVISDRLWYSTD